MFKSFISTRIETSMPKEEIYNLLEDRLQDLGYTDISGSGGITISGNRFEGFGYTSEIYGKIRGNNKYYSVNIDINMRPEIIAWLIAICFFPLGLLVLILPLNAKNETESILNQILDDLKYDIEEDNL